jgi:Flp pilus assembly protein TadG
MMPTYRRLRRALNRLLRRQSGATLVEFAVSLTVMLTFLFVFLETCIAIYTYEMVSDCAKEASRFAVTRGSTCQTSSSTSCTTTVAAINAHATGMGFPNPGGGSMTFPNTQFPVSNGTTCTTVPIPGCQVKVIINYTMPIKLPFVPKNSLSWTTSSEMYILQ